MKAFDQLAAAAWAALAGWALALKAGLIPVSSLQWPSLCLFKFWWGLPCPGCGMGHAVLYAFLGRWGESWRSHPLGLPFLVFWTYWLARGLLNAWRPRLGAFPSCRARLPRKLAQLRQ